MSDRTATIQGLRDISHSQRGVALRFTDVGPSEGGVEAHAITSAPATGPGAGASLLSGQFSATTTPAPVEAIGSGHAVAEVYIQNDPSSGASIQVGTAHAQDSVLQPGAGDWYPAINTSQISIAAVTGTASVNWVAPSATGGTIAVSTTATALTTSAACAEVVVQADVSNTVPVLVGNASAQHTALTAGATMRLKVADPSLVYVKTASGTATLYWQSRAKL